MIELILTNTLDSLPILDKLKNSLKETKKHYIFVPDRFSLSYQKAVLEHLGIKGSFDIEVTSFVRMANKLLENDKKVLDKQSEIMLIRKVIEDSKDSLLSFGRVSNSVNFASDMYAAISQIRNSNISVKRMADIADGLPVRVANKTKDIVKIYREYIEFLQNGYTDGTSKLQALTDIIYQGCLKDCNIYISDFMSFSNVEYEVIKALMLNSMNTYISLVDSTNENKHIFPVDVKGRLYSIAQEIGLNIKTNYKEQSLSGDAKIIHEELFGYAPNSQGQRDGKTNIYVCKSIAQEVKFVARQINYLVKEKGARYKDIAIVCCDYPAYTPYIKSVFDDFGIPFYADIKQSLGNQALTKLIVASIQAVLGQFDSQSVFELAKQILLAIDYDKVCIFENYCLKYGIEYTRFLTPFEIGNEEDRQIAEDIRSKLVAIVKPLQIEDNICEVNTYVNAINNFLHSVNAQTLVDWLAQNQQDNGFADMSAITLQSLPKISVLLERFRAMLGKSKMSFEEFFRIFMTAVESVEMSNIPLYVDSVFIGESSQSRYEDIDYMYVIGANAGKFPLEHSDTGIVAEREYVAWANMGINVQPDCKRRNAQERLSVLMLLTRAKKQLNISYPSSDIAGSELLASNTVEYLCQLLDTKPQSVQDPNSMWSKEDYMRYVSAKGNIVQELLALNTMQKQGSIDCSDTLLEIMDTLYTLACKDYGETYIDNLLLGQAEEKELDKDNDIMFRGNNTSVSQFEKYFNCPFLHFNENVLKLKTREINGLEVKDTGILLHEVMEKYFALSDCANKTQEQISQIASQLMLDAIADNSDYAYLLNDKSNTLRLKQLTNQAVYVVQNLVKNMQVTKFRPYKLEAKFGFDSPDSIKGMEIDNGYRKLSFCGVIDRIDKYEDRVIVIDYKSKSRIDFAPANILYGDRIQLFVYLNALRNSGDITPQGVFYLLMNNRFIKKDETNRFMFKGFVNGQSEYLKDLDKGFEGAENFASSVYPIKVKTNKDGTSTYSSIAEGSMLDNQKFDLTCDYVMKLTQKAAKEIEEGYIAKSPLNIGGKEEAKVCAYCNYRNVCNRSKVINRDVKKADISDFLQILEEGVCQK